MSDTRTFYVRTDASELLAEVAGLSAVSLEPVAAKWYCEWCKWDWSHGPDTDHPGHWAVFDE